MLFVPFLGALCVGAWIYMKRRSASRRQVEPERPTDLMRPIVPRRLALPALGVLRSPAHLNLLAYVCFIAYKCL